MKRILLQAAVAAIALGNALPAAAICKWRDADGRMQYADKPPPGARCEGTVSVSPPASTSTANKPPPRSVQDQEMEFRKRRLEREEAEKKAQKEDEAAQARRQNCEAARAQAAGLGAGGRVVRYDANGQRMFLSEEEVAAELERARKQVSQYCK